MVLHTKMICNTTALPKDSAQLCEGCGEDSTAQGVMPRSSAAWEGRNSMNTCSNMTSEESIGIYAKSKCQWSGRLIDLESEPQRYGHLKPQGP